VTAVLRRFSRKALDRANPCRWHPREGIADHDAPLCQAREPDHAGLGEGETRALTDRGHADFAEWDRELTRIGSQIVDSARVPGPWPGGLPLCQRMTWTPE